MAANRQPDCRLVHSGRWQAGRSRPHASIAQRRHAAAAKEAAAVGHSAPAGVPTAQEPTEPRLRPRCCRLHCNRRSHRRQRSPVGAQPRALSVGRNWPCGSRGPSLPTAPATGLVPAPRRRTGSHPPAVSRHLCQDRLGGRRRQPMRFSRRKCSGVVLLQRLLLLPPVRPGSASGAQQPAAAGYDKLAGRSWARPCGLCPGLGPRQLHLSACPHGMLWRRRRRRPGRACTAFGEPAVVGPRERRRATLPPPGHQRCGRSCGRGNQPYNLTDRA